MSDNAALLKRLRSLAFHIRETHSADGQDARTADEAADALERAERHWSFAASKAEVEERNASYWHKLFVQKYSECDKAVNKLRAAAASEAAMREALVALVHEIDDEGIFDDASDWPANARAALSAPASALAQRYEAVVTAARLTVYDKIEGVVFVCEACATELYDALAALHHPTPTKDDEA